MRQFRRKPRVTCTGTPGPSPFPEPRACTLPSGGPSFPERVGARASGGRCGEGPGPGWLEPQDLHSRPQEAPGSTLPTSCSSRGSWWSLGSLGWEHHLLSPPCGHQAPCVSPGVPLPGGTPAPGCRPPPLQQDRILMNIISKDPISKDSQMAGFRVGKNLGKGHWSTQCGRFF